MKKRSVTYLALALAALSSQSQAAENCWRYQAMSFTDHESKNVYIGGGQVEVKSYMCGTTMGADTECQSQFSDHLRQYYNLRSSNYTKGGWGYKSSQEADAGKREMARDGENLNYAVVHTQFSCNIQAR